jgi:hypothetical protein
VADDSPACFHFTDALFMTTSPLMCLVDEVDEVELQEL